MIVPTVEVLYTCDAIAFVFARFVVNAATCSTHSFDKLLHFQFRTFFLFSLKLCSEKSYKIFSMKGEGERQALDVLGAEDGGSPADGLRLIEQHVDPAHAKAQLK